MCLIFVLPPNPHAIIIQILVNAVITVGDASNQEGILCDTTQYFLNFKNIRQNHHQKTLTHIREIKKITEETTQLRLLIRIITLRSSNGPNFYPL